MIPTQNDKTSNMDFSLVDCNAGANNNISGNNSNNNSSKIVPNNNNISRDNDITNIEELYNNNSNNNIVVTPDYCLSEHYYSVKHNNKLQFLYLLSIGLTGVGDDKDCNLIDLNAEPWNMESKSSFRCTKEDFNNKIWFRYNHFYSNRKKPSSTNWTNMKRYNWL